MSEREPLDFDAIEARLERARQHVYNLCSGKERWTMSVPVEEDRDSDCVLIAAIDAADDMLAVLRPAAPSPDGVEQP